MYKFILKFSSYMVKQKEIATLNHTIREEQAKFSQALNVMITETNKWLMTYVVSSPLAGGLALREFYRKTRT